MTFVHGLKGNCCCTSSIPLCTHFDSTREQTRCTDFQEWMLARAILPAGGITALKVIAQGWCTSCLQELDKPERVFLSWPGHFNTPFYLQPDGADEAVIRIMQLFREGLELKGEHVRSKRACFGLLIQISFCNLAFSHSLLLLHC